jgi:hypothetical protein
LCALKVSLNVVARTLGSVMTIAIGNSFEPF